MICYDLQIQIRFQETYFVSGYSLSFYFLLSLYLYLSLHFFSLFLSLSLFFISLVVFFVPDYCDLWFQSSIWFQYASIDFSTSACAFLMLRSLVDPVNSSSWQCTSYQASFEPSSFLYCRPIDMTTNL